MLDDEQKEIMLESMREHMDKPHRYHRRPHRRY
jgi:hypothetical protein